MSTQIQRRRGTTAEHSTFTGVEGELTVDTTKDTVVVHDGATTGGRPLLREDQTNLPTSVTNGISVPSANNVAISTSGAGRLFVDASGNVGVGTTPGRTLDVAGSIRSGGSTNPYIALNDNTAEAYFEISSSVTRISSGASQPLAFRIGSSEAARFDSSGRLGLGTSVPSYDLQIKANTPQLALQPTADTQEAQILFRNAADSASAGSIVYDHGNSFLKVNVNGAERARIDSSGRLGVGTTDNEGFKFKVTESGGNLARFTNGATQTMDVVLDGDGFTLQNPNNGYIAFKGSSTERARIDSSGRLGIGTSSPSALLDVRGNIYSTGAINDFGSGQYPIIRVNSSTNNAIFGFALDGNQSGAYNGRDWRIEQGRSATGAFNITDITAGNLVRLAINSSGNVGIGVTNPQHPLVVGNGTDDALNVDTLATGEGVVLRSFNAGATDYEPFGIAAEYVNFYIRTGVNSSAERMRLDSSGRLLVGTSSTRGVGIADVLSIQHEAAYGGISVVTNRNDGDSSYVCLGKSRGTAAGSNTVLQSGDTIGRIVFAGADGTDMQSRAAEIGVWVDGTPGVDDMPGRLVFSTTADGASSPTERMTIDSTGNVLVGQFPADSGQEGIRLTQSGLVIATRVSDYGLLINRLTSDGDLVAFRHDSIQEGSISVSGTTVSYNGAHLSRWAQLPSGAERTEILRGSVLSNIDEMCEWGDEDNEQLNRMKVSDVEGDKNVAGVFQAWDDDDDTYTNDFYCAMTGDFIIRIGAGVTVQRGDLLMSAGDGTAKPQDDDIIRSKTIAKVTSTNVSCTYPDGSYCVPCVLMAC